MAHHNQTESVNLVADVGGTNTRLALSRGNMLIEKSVRRYRNSDFANLEEVLKRFLFDEHDVCPQATCIAVAGPVQNGTATLTNLDWSINEQTLKSATRANSVAILNDLQAQGHALAHLDSQHIKTVLDGKIRDPDGTRLMVGVGTGFNSAPVLRVGSELVVSPSETGHANLPIRNEQDLLVANSLTDAHGFPAIEEVLSGRGLERLYGFLSEPLVEKKSKSAAAIMASCADGNDKVAIEAARIFSRFLGTVCGNLALIQLPLGGIYLVGGVSRAFAPFLDDFGFQIAFKDKGRFSQFMDQFSVHIIDDDYSALTGCAAFLSGLNGSSNEAAA